MNTLYDSTKMKSSLASSLYNQRIIKQSLPYNLSGLILILTTISIIITLCNCNENVPLSSTIIKKVNFDQQQQQHQPLPTPATLSLEKISNDIDQHQDDDVGRRRMLALIKHLQNNNSMIFGSTSVSNETTTATTTISSTIHIETSKKPSRISNWWRLGTRKNYAKHYLHVNASTFKEQCAKIEFLSPLQKELCSLHHNILQSVARGARFGIEECQFQFKMNRWNCSASDDPVSVFGPVLDINSREKAFIHAISTAGVVFSVTRSCTKGELSQCGCDDKVKSQDIKGKWEWGGCSDDIYYGAEFSRRFIDSIEDPNTAEGVMNLHNNEVGRRVMKSKMELVCKCHGVSGSCTIKVCWRRMKPFREVGQELAQKFDGATHVKLVQSRKKRSRLKPAQKNVKKPSKRDLVYLEDSPDFCFRNATLGAFGTSERICNSTSYGLDGCRYLCCGRGYRTIEREVDQKCNCKFVWCCQVKCDMCRIKLIEHRCN